jgi:RNA polymerase sigma-70 factor (ECF subfamily)
MTTPPAKLTGEAEWASDDPGIELCLAGHSLSIERLFRAYAPLVQGVIGKLVGPTPDFEDLVQTTFAEALGNLSRFRGEAKLSTWLCGIAVHVAHHHLRAGKVRRHVPLELVADGGEPAGPFVADTRGADETIDSRRLTIKLHKLLDRISPKKRIALLLYVMEDRSVQEIAALMKATQTATRSRMFFARRELRTLIASDAELRDLASAIFEKPSAGHA